VQTKLAGRDLSLVVKTTRRILTDLGSLRRRAMLEVRATRPSPTPHSKSLVHGPNPSEVGVTYMSKQAHKHSFRTYSAFPSPALRMRRVPR